jgi:signal transduction histidine kinase
MATEQVDNAEQEMDLPNLCRAVADASPMAMAGLGGPVHTLRYVNLAFCLLTGKSKDELIGTPFSGIAPCANECMVLLDRVAKTGLADSHTGQEHIHPLYWSFAMWPLLGANQSHLGIMVQITEATRFHDDAVAMNQALLLGSVRQHELMEAEETLNTKLQAEMTERKRAEDERLKAGALQRAIFNSANFSSIATDAHGVIQIFNVGAERMLGYTAAEVMNQITPADISDPREVIARAAALSLELGTTITPGFEALVFKASREIEDIYELTYIRKDGSRFPAVVSVTALRDAQNTIIGYLLIGTDNTARKQAEEALLRSEMLASAGRMAAVLAHEINNPLAAVMNLLFLAQTTGEIPAPVHRYLKMADGEVKRIANITRQTLGFYRESSGPTTFLVVTLLNSVIDLLQAKMVSTQVIVEKQCDDLLQITATFGELRQVISNLMLNSLDALGEGGRVTLRASTSRSPVDGSSRIRITIADNGQGISAAALPRIFEPFFTSKGSTGNGLGLWVGKQIIEKHGGSIWVRSRTCEPQGTTFSMVLPEPAP